MILAGSPVGQAKGHNYEESGKTNNGIDANTQRVIASTFALAKDLRSNLPKEGLELILTSIAHINLAFLRQAESNNYETALLLADQIWTHFHYPLIHLTKRALTGLVERNNVEREDQVKSTKSRVSVSEDISMELDLDSGSGSGSGLDSSLNEEPVDSVAEITAFSFSLIASIRHFYSDLLETFLNNWGVSSEVEHVLKAHEILEEKQFTECSEKITATVSKTAFIILCRFGDVSRYLDDFKIKAGKKVQPGYTKACSFYKGACDLNHYDGEPYTQLGKIYLSSKRYDLAVYYILKSIVVDKPHVKDNLMKVGRTLKKNANETEVTRNGVLKVITPMLLLYEIDSSSSSLKASMEQSTEQMKSLVNESSEAYHNLLSQYSTSSIERLNEGRECLVRVALITVMLAWLKDDSSSLVATAIEIMKITIDWCSAGNKHGFFHLRILLNWFRKRYSLPHVYLRDQALFQATHIIQKLVSFGSWLQYNVGLDFDPLTSVPAPRPPVDYQNPDTSSNDVSINDFYEETESLGVLALNNGLDDLPSGLLASMPSLEPTQQAAQCLLSELYELTYMNIGIEQATVDDECQLKISSSVTNMDNLVNVETMLDSMDISDAESSSSFSDGEEIVFQGRNKHL